MWVQMDVATKADNSLLAIITPADWNAQQGSDTHEGCRVLEMTGGDPPALARGTSGRLRVRARILASDLVPIGPSSCGYEPASNSGIILARKVPNTAGGGSWSLHRTGVAP